MGAELTGCHYYDYRLKIVNHSAAPIFVEVFKSPVPGYSGVNGTEYYREHLIAPDSTYDFMMPGKQGWPSFVRNSSNRRLNLCVFQARDLDRTNSIDSLIRHQKYTLVTLSESALDSMHWRVIYSAPVQIP